MIPDYNQNAPYGDQFNDVRNAGMDQCNRQDSKDANIHYIPRIQDLEFQNGMLTFKIQDLQRDVKGWIWVSRIMAAIIGILVGVYVF